MSLSTHDHDTEYKSELGYEVLYLINELPALETKQVHADELYKAAANIANGMDFILKRIDIPEATAEESLAAIRENLKAIGVSVSDGSIKSAAAVIDTSVNGVKF